MRRRGIGQPARWGVPMKPAPISVKRIHHIEFFVGNAKQADYYFRQAFGFSRVAYAGLETGQRDRASYALAQGTARILVTTPLVSEGRIASHVTRHGDGVADIALEVDDADQAFTLALERGAEPAMEPNTLRDDQGSVRRAAVRIYGDTIHSFLSTQDYTGPFLPGFAASEVSGRSAGLLGVDHFVANVRLGEMKQWEAWYESVLGLERYMTFDDKDISTEFSALNSVVMANASRSVKF